MKNLRRKSVRSGHRHKHKSARAGNESGDGGSLSKRTGGETPISGAAAALDASELELERGAEDYGNYKMGKPMRDRQFPPSFWVQPERPSANFQCVIPLDARGELLETRTTAILIPTPPDTNLLFSLFKILEHHRSVALHSSATNGESCTATSTSTLAPTVRSKAIGRDRHRKPRQRLDRKRRMDQRKVAVADQSQAQVAAGLQVGDNEAGGCLRADPLPDVVAGHLVSLARHDSVSSNDSYAAASRHCGRHNNIHISSSSSSSNNHNSSNNNNNNNDEDDDLATDDPYLTGGSRKSHEVRSMLMLMAERRDTAMASVAAAAVAAAASATAGGVSSSSCYSDLLSDLVVNL